MNQQLTEMKGERDTSIITVGDFNTPLPTMVEEQWDRDQQGNRRLETQYKPTRPKRHL